MITTIVRGCMMVIGGILTGQGLASTDEVQTLTDSIMTIAGGATAVVAFGWSAYKRYQATRVPKPE